MSSVATCLALWSVIQQRVYDTRVRDIDELLQRLLHVWRGLEQSQIDDAVDHKASSKNFSLRDNQ